MLTFPGITPVDYLVIGHITQDITADGLRPGGTVSFAALTARALGLRVGIVTSWASESGAEWFEDIQIANLESEASTTFENIYTPDGRIQKIHHLAPQLGYFHIPESWRSAQIVHIGPVAGEVDPTLVQYFKDSHVYLTPQGYLRQWNQEGHVRFSDWPEASYILPQAHAAVISEEDAKGDQSLINSMAASIPVLAVTKGYLGVDLYAYGDLVSFPAPEIEEIDPYRRRRYFCSRVFHPANLLQRPAPTLRSLQSASLPIRLPAPACLAHLRKTRSINLLERYKLWQLSTPS